MTTIVASTNKNDKSRFIQRIISTFSDDY